MYPFTYKRVTHHSYYSCKWKSCYRLVSGRRGSNSRPLAWKANALSTELLPQKQTASERFLMSSSDVCNPDRFHLSGKRWIRTTEGVRQQIYSLPHLATLVSSQFLLLQLDLSTKRADGGIRTHDPEITNHVLWPTELHRH